MSGDGGILLLGSSNVIRPPGERFRLVVRTDIRVEAVSRRRFLVVEVQYFWDLLTPTRVHEERGSGPTVPTELLGHVPAAPTQNDDELR